MNGLDGSFSSDFHQILIFCHTLGMALLVGSLFFLRIYIKPLLDELQSPVQRYQIALDAIRRFWFVFIVSLAFVAICAFLLDDMEPDSQRSPVYAIIANVIQLLFALMMLLTLWMYVKYRQIKRLYVTKNFIDTHESLVLFLNYMVPFKMMIALMILYFCIMIGR